MTRVIGFYTDEKGKVRPITSSSGWRLAEPKIEKPEEKIATEEITLVKHPVSYEKSTKKSSMSSTLRLMQRVWVEQTGDKIAVKSPYTPQFIKSAKELGGVWDPKTETWRFPRVMEKRVRDTLYEIYGETGDGPVEVVDVRVKIDPFVKSRTSDLWIFNRKVFEAQRYGVKKDKNIAIISGELPNETLYGDVGKLRGRNIEVMIPDVPKALAERYAKGMPEEVKIIEGEIL